MNYPKNCSYCKTLLKPAWKQDSFLKCPNCELLIRNQPIDSQQLDQLYTNSWNNPNDEVSETGGTTSKLADRYCKHLIHSLGENSLKGKTILDFGAGRGEMAIALLKTGARVCAVEPYGYQFLQKQGVEVFRNLGDIPKSYSFDGVVSLDVVEHLLTPWNELKSLQNLLTPGGWVFISTPNANSLNARITGSKWREAQRKGHILLFSVSFVQPVSKVL